RRKQVAATSVEVGFALARGIAAMTGLALGLEHQLAALRVGRTRDRLDRHQSAAHHRGTWLRLAAEPAQVGQDGLELRSLHLDGYGARTEHAQRSLFERDHLARFGVE